ncbi:HAD domain-containing protein [Microbacterium sp. Mcb102]|uniref:HAD domain-containing protein n=1 Tax=Microbacterium sp. Mcb102 TaxID=2926012 RepID=UPI0021C9AFBD|nr:HAD domain-containing protein [Microbacterium sp. Mcb102]
MDTRSHQRSALLVLDVDGTISRIHREEERALHQNDEGWRSWMTVDDELVDALDDLARRPGVQVAWLTTWPRDQVGWLIREPLRGKLTGPYVPWQNWPKRGWRTASLISHIRQTSPNAVVWADDRAPEDAEQRLTAMTEVPSLVVRPDKFVGVTLADVGRIDQFLDEQLVL